MFFSSKSKYHARKLWFVGPKAANDDDVLLYTGYLMANGIFWKYYRSKVDIKTFFLFLRNEDPFDIQSLGFVPRV